MASPSFSPLDRIAASSRLSAGVLLIVAGMLLIPGLAEMPLMDRDEPRFAQATWEMHEQGQWWVPYFNREYRFDKPPLTYWWMELHYLAFGRNEFAARFHSVLAAWLVAWVIRSLGSFLYSPRAGFLAGLGWLSFFQVLVHGRLCVADMPMLLAVTLTMLASARLLFSSEAPRRFGPWFWALTGALTLGFLAKGPVAWAVPMLGLLLTRWVWWRKPLPWNRLQPVSAFLIATAAVGIWGIPALAQTEGAFWQVGIGEHVVKRGTSAFNGRVTIPVVFYLVSAFLSLLPWSHFAPAALFQGERGRDDLRRSFLLGWFVAPFLVFGLYATQLPHYIMPGFPAFALLLFREGKLPAISGKLGRSWFWSVTGVLGVVSLVFGIVALLLPWPEEMSQFRTLGVVISFGLFAASVVAPLVLKMQAGRTPGLPVLAVWMSLLIGVSCCFAIGGKAIRSMHPAVKLTEQFWSELPAQTKFRACEFTEPSLVFYLPSGGVGWKMGGNIEKAHEWFARTTSKRAGVYLLREWTASDALEHCWTEKTFAGVLPGRDSSAAVEAGIDESRYETRTFRGYNVARSSWVELLVLIPKNR